MIATIVRSRWQYRNSIPRERVLGDRKRSCRIVDSMIIERRGLFYRVRCFDAARGSFASRCGWEHKFLTRKNAIAAAYLHLGYPWQAQQRHEEAFDKIRHPDPFWDRGVKPREPRKRSDCPVYRAVLWCPVCTPKRDISYASGRGYN